MTDYTEIILDHYRRPRHQGILPSPCLSATVSNSSCGDSLTVYYRIKSGKVTDFKWQGVGCAISQAAASIVSDKIIGKPIFSVRPLRVNPARAACASLVIKAILDAC
ncbi:hypothetical protein A2899_01605 [Candidatus Amesbacteria bacterium RIFCSPLOWO2_01_FULL_49_25]|uniref:NIF system FeS cluster assembly NifU N-terminal domain-containing protein n=1 Tax=Candidatus Amesbacteria bacterium RIFCSPHIGHO2_01_FULL_48_32b TaxID=1797253 RepID=A0A1F4YDV3_9BACT|nr:MAG: hypothetical protein A2876_03265 [Candidatus Amesbacteria bacterium RIFCSPHIGHO2_01_FULL_48_32b]OGD08471.1 MAG: hypothetical protein A2899_01605 [Candidatus Amesbacteria bacterium RIFCSPLOWO2_01_FULL_49_25]